MGKQVGHGMVIFCCPQPHILYSNGAWNLMCSCLSAIQVKFHCQQIISFKLSRNEGFSFSFSWFFFWPKEKKLKSVMVLEKDHDGKRELRNAKIGVKFRK